ncbi:MAG: hypothetical protein WKF35_01360 [Ferruginibacter sp.]
MKISDPREQIPSIQDVEKEKNKNSTDLDTSKKGREEEVIDQQDPESKAGPNNSNNNEGEDQFRQGIGDNDTRSTKTRESGDENIQP